jgi:hypothetical protein
VANIKGANGYDNSAFVSDRFWQINAQGYSVKPSLNNLKFMYRDVENESPNTISENLLIAKRYNISEGSWIDNICSSSINTAANTLTVSTVDDSNLHAWWMLGTSNTNRYWVAPSSSTVNVSTNWSETSGGTGNAGVPVTGDAIFFDGSSNGNCILDSDLLVSSLTITPEFTGAITQGSNMISVDRKAVFSGGTFVGGNADIIVGEDFTVSGTSFTAPVSTLEIKGNFTVTSGSFSHNNGTVLFSGTNGLTQSITSNSAITFNNISVTNASVSPGVSIQSHQNLKGVLTLANNVNFDADGSSNTAVFKLLSTGDAPTKDAAIAALPIGAQVTGKVTVQRFMTKEGANNGRIYRYISSPIQYATVADLQQEIPVTGTFTGRSSCSGCTASSQSLFAYNEAIITDTDGNGSANLHDGYIDFPDISNTETFQSGRGYALYVRSNILSSTSWDLRGQINNANETPLSFPVTYTSSGSLADDGWNLVGNPFPSTIDWNADNGWTKTNLESSVYITDNGSAASLRFVTWNGVVGTNGGSRYIPIGQGFWVKANGNGVPVLQANENVKAAGTQTTFFREAQLTNLLRITVGQGALRDETIIHFRDDATDAFDHHADAHKLPNSILNISSVLEDGKFVSINSISPFNCNTVIPLSIDNANPGNYTLSFTELESFPEDINIYLTDTFLDRTFNVRNENYSFSITSAAASYGASRFKIEFNSIILNTELNLTTAAICDGDEAIVVIENSQTGVSYAAIFANNIIPAKHNDDGVTTITIPKGKLESRETEILIRATSAHCNTVVEKNVLINVEPIITPVTTSTINCGEGSLTLKAFGAPDGSYHWYEEQTSEYAIESQHAGIFQTPILKKSKTYYVSAVNALGCESQRIPVNATITYLDPVAIAHTNRLLISSYSDGNQWYLNGEKLEGATQQSIQPAESGIYKTVVTSNSCVTIAETTFTITPKVISPGPIEQNETEEGETESHEEPQEPLITEIEKGIFEEIIRISPNPVRETALLEVSNNLQPITQVRVINSIGQIVSYVTLSQTNEKKTGVIQMGEYPSGIYIIQIFYNKGVHERKIIKQ